MARGFGLNKGVGSTDVVLTALTAQAAQRSWSVWFKRNGNGTLLNKTSELFGYSAGAWRFTRSFSGTNGAWSFNLGTATGVWTHCLWGYDSSSTSNVPFAYFDAVLATTTTTTPPVGTASTNAIAYRIGNNVAGNGVFDGEAAEAAMWNSLLGQADASQLAKASPEFVRGAVLHVFMRGPLRDSRSTGAVTATGTLQTSHPRILLPEPGRFPALPPPQSIAVPVLGATGALLSIAPTLVIEPAALGAAGALGAVSPELDVAVAEIAAEASLDALAMEETIEVPTLTATGTADEPGIELLITPEAITATGTLEAITPELTIAVESISASAALEALGLEAHVNLPALIASGDLGAIGIERLIDLSALDATATADALIAALTIGLPALQATGGALVASLDQIVQLGLLPASAAARPFSVSAVGAALTISIGVLAATAGLLAIVPYARAKHPVRLVLLVPARRRLELLSPARRKIQVL